MLTPSTSSIVINEDELSSVISRISSGHAPFAIIKKENSDEALILEGALSEHHHLDDLRNGDGPYGLEPGIHSIHAIPYAQIREKGFDIADETPIQSIHIQRVTRIHIAQLLSQLPDDAVEIEGPLQHFPDDQTFIENVKAAKEAIHNGLGSSFTISRKAKTKIANYTRSSLLSMFRSLNMNEYGGYMNFIFHSGRNALIGASPERYVSAEDGVVTMNPISGTLRKFPQAITKERLIGFLRDPKEKMELFKVLDEELKQMAQMCDCGGVVKGPFLKEMSKVVHTYYELVGHSNKDPLDLVRYAMHPPTVISSPFYRGPEIIAALEKEIRRYYAGCIMYTGLNEREEPYVDGAIAIRMAEVAEDGSIVFQAGATVVHDSDPSQESQETHGKLAGPLNAMLYPSSDPPKPVLAHFLDDEVRAILEDRNHDLSDFHLQDQENADHRIDELVGKNVTIINNEDDFCYMLKHMIARMGASATVVRYDEFDADSDVSDIVIVGPGTGDPADPYDPKMQKVASDIRHLMRTDKPFLSVCLGHQILCKELGLGLHRKDVPTQGVQKEIDLFGKQERVAFYNSFAASGELPEEIESCVDPDNKEVHAVKGPHFAGFQFHPESVLTKNGYSILAEQLIRILPQK